MTDNDTAEFPDSMASAMKDEDAHDGAVAFCREYPDSGLADHVRMCVRNDWDLFANASSYERNFLERGPEAALANADPTRATKIANLFPEFADHPNVPDDVQAAGESDEEVVDDAA